MANKTTTAGDDARNGGAHAGLGLDGGAREGAGGGVGAKEGSKLSIQLQEKSSVCPSSCRLRRKKRDAQCWSCLKQ